MTQFAQMNKAELRVACKDAGINYSKLTVGGMRDTLAAMVERFTTLPEIEAPAPTQRPAPVTTGVKIEKVREERNGIKRPSAGGKCRAVWDALDALQAELEAGEAVTSKMVKDLATDEGWNANNASIEFYQWRKFNGVTGRSK